MNMDTTRTSSTRSYGIPGFMSAILSLLLLSEIFGSVAIILGAYTWRNEPNSSLGLIVLILGISFMLVGIYFTAYPLIIDLIYGI